MKILLLTLFFSISISSNVLDDLIIKKKSSINQVIVELLLSGLTDEANNSNPQLGKDICMSVGQSSFQCRGSNSISKGICMAAGYSSLGCSGANTIPQAICMAGGRSTLGCIGATTISQAICMAGGRSTLGCIDVNTIPKAICINGGGSSYSCNFTKTVREAINNIPYVDRTYWWDKFRDQYGNEQWRCRGGQTKQFAENSKCSGVSKDDERWPG